MLKEPVTAPVRWWHCACLTCVSGLRRLEKTLTFLRCLHVFDLVLKYGSDINEGNWLQILFYFFVIIGIVASVIWMSFFSAVFQVLDRSFSYCTLTETFAIGFQKWFGHEWIDFEVFCSKMVSFVDFIPVWTKICNNCSIVIHIDGIKFFWCFVWAVFCSVL